MKNKILLTIIIGMFFFSLISVSAFDAHKQNTDYDLTISHNLATSCQTTWIRLPNGSQNILNLDMTKDGTTFYSTITSGNFSSLGTTCLGISCTDGSTTEVGSKCIDVNPQGFELREDSGIIYAVSLLIVLIIFLITLYYGITIPWANQRSPDGHILHIDYKKYMKMALLFISYLILTFLFAMGKGMSYAFLQSTEAYGFFNIGFGILLIGIMPVFITMFYFTVMAAIFDKKVQRAIERGLPVR
jgi:hypothetical protein